MGESPPGREPPFPGSRPYRPDEAAFFHGRSEETRSLAALWGTSRVTVLHGAPGTGKTSLLEAGAYPLLRETAHDVLPPGRLARHADHPSGALPESGRPAYSLLRGWLPEMPPTAVADTTVGRYLDELAYRPGPVLLAVDQAERLFGGCDQDGHRALLDDLRETVRRHPSLHVLFSVRSGHENEIAEAFAFAGTAEFELTGLPAPRAAGAVGAALESAGRRRSLSRAAVGALARALGPAPETGEHAEEGEPASDGAGVVHPPVLQHVAAGLWRAWPEAPFLGPERITRSLVSDWIAEGIWKDIAWAAALTSDDPQTIAERLASLGREPTTPPLPQDVADVLTDRHVLLPARNGLFTTASPRLAEPIDALSRRAPSLPSPSFRAGDWVAAAAHALDRCDTRLARRAALTALDLAEGMGQGLQARILLGDAAYEAGDPAEAEHFYAEAAVLAEAHRAGTLVGALLASVGRIQMARGETGEAIQSLSWASARLPGDGLVSRELHRAFARMSGGWAARHSV
ncbi:ATP-binding protein [Actinomadura sp. K4S16]|uniref:nSTAND1 domain-containing NTPase n=1 Tax=Actinomadura sp. K4S16 TaxID=1316147 RepID=UPI001F1CD173|nr:ATP-binding protein [Actinomadura sp. K4S16]